MATQNELALQMLQQLRILDPALSGEIGTPERKIIDTVAQALSENQVDFNIITGAFDLDAKFGTDLNNFLSVFGFGRQQPTSSSGYVTFKRSTASVYDVPIPRNTTVTASNLALDGGFGYSALTFVTTEPVTLAAGSLSVTAPIKCATPGTLGNVAAGEINQFGATPILGITSVTNDIATQAGTDAESDDEYKIRFKNTVFRNLAGTEDQFLALAVSTQYTTKANVVGPISRYREYIQIPDVDDATADPDSGITGNGSAGEYTSALSVIPYSKHTYETIPFFVSNGGSGSSGIFYRQEIDFTLNKTDSARDKGDAYRGRISPNTSPSALDPNYQFHPNLTFMNVFVGSDVAVQALRPMDIVLFEHSYISTESRNDWDRKVLNCVDVYINGSNSITANAVIPRPPATQNIFVAATGNRLYINNFRRVNDPERRPVAGNVFTPLFWQPTVDLPDTITTSDAIYTKGTHYWAVEDVTELSNTVRARNGIEWSMGTPGQAESDSNEGPFTAPKITGSIDDAISINGYIYDKNVIDLQTALEGNKQVTTDVLAHRSKTRFFKFDVTIMYASQSASSDVNLAIQYYLSNYLSSQYFGSVIQLSDILQVIHNVSGVDNVRWSQDLLSTRDCIVECDLNGNPLLNVLIDSRLAGNSSTVAKQQMYIVGSPTGGTFKLSYQGLVTAPIAYNASLATISTELYNAGIPVGTVTGTGTVVAPFVMTFISEGQRDLITSDPTALTGGSSIFNKDFYLSDDELPSLCLSATADDTLPGLILRARAQNVWDQL